MREVFRIAAALAASAIVAAGMQSAAQAQPYGPGMMGGYGPGYMMGPGYGPGYMIGPGYGPGWMMGGYGPGWMMGPGPGWMMRGGWGPGHYVNQGNLNLSTDDVKSYLERMIRNPNLKVGEVKEKNADTIIAEIVTKQGDSLVQRFEFNRHTGYYRPEQ